MVGGWVVGPATSTAGGTFSDIPYWQLSQFQVRTRPVTPLALIIASTVRVSYVAEFSLIGVHLRQST